MPRVRSAWFAALALACAACSEPPPPPRNLLVLLLDTTRADHLSCYGYGRETTPAIDGLARQGTRFEQIFAQSSLTPVSAGTLLSGAQPYRHGVRSLFVVGKESLSKEVASLPELLARSGRRTAAFVSAKPMGAQYGLSRGFESYDDEVSPSPDDAPQRPADETTARVLPWLDAHGREPFALLVHFFDTHDPSCLPPRDWLAGHVSFPLPDPLERVGDQARIPALVAPEARVELYDAELRYVDEHVARILAKLEQLGVREDTLVAVVADHGEAFGEHGFWTHGILYEEQLHVPLILSGPGIERGRIVAARGRLVDFLPTVAELLDLPAPREALDGSSLAPLLRGGKAPEPREVYAEVHHAAGDRLGREAEMYALRIHDWKYVHRPLSGRHQLFDLAADPGELNDLYAPEHPRARAMAYRLGRMGALGGELPTLEGLSAEQIEELRRLGYL